MQDLILKLYWTARSVLNRTDGQNMTEYAMAVGLIACGCVAAEAAIATSVNRVLVATATTIVNGVMQ
jgi:Flp pilus assembly pilin Flp